MTYKYNLKETPDMMTVNRFDFNEHQIGDSRKINISW
jgi:hypothetical protein